ncbi:MAG: hypothetical protein AAB320_08745 [Elusimicrobiota bacterium]
MSRALALLLLLSVPLSAATAPKRKAVVPQTKAGDKLAFEQTFEFILLQAGQSYLKDEAMPDPSALEPFLAPLKEPELGKAKLKTQRLLALVANAENVQLGPQGLAEDLFKMIVDQAADDLDVGSIVEQNFLPNGRAGRSLDAREKGLVKDCQAAARDKTYDRRSFYQQCLGRRQAEATYLGKPGPSLSDDSASAQARIRLLEAAAAARSRLPAGLSEDIRLRLQETQARLLARLPSIEPGMAVGVPVSPRSGLPSAKPGLRRSDPAGSDKNAFLQAKDLRTAEPPMDQADLSAGTQLARISKRDEIGFTGYCYSYVKSALQKAGIVDKATIAKAGAAGHAKLFAEFADKNPGLLKRKLRRLPKPSWPLPIGTVVVWSPNACGYSAESGHIEIITRIKPPQACSDGCGAFQVACLEELAADPARAQQELAKAQEDYRRAQTAYDALTARKARQAAAAPLSRKKRTLAGVLKRLEPQVAAYVIERPNASAPAVGR